MSFSDILKNTLNPDPNFRNKAEEDLKKLESENFPNFLGLLATELANEQAPPETRQSAGIQIKNALSSRKLSVLEQKTRRWLSVDSAIRDKIKSIILQALASPQKFARTAAAQATAQIALAELPEGQWKEVIQGLATPVIQNNPNVFLKESSLEALGYICEEIEPEIIEEQSAAILTAVVAGMNKDGGNLDVIFAATKALRDTLEFCEKNFENKEHRDRIMMEICQATQIQHEQIRAAAYECLVRVAALYYEKLPPYMQSLFNITIQAMNSDADDAAAQAIEFWKAIAEEEEYRPDKNMVCHRFIPGALEYVIPPITKCLMRQDEIEFETNVVTSAATCLRAIAMVVGDSILNYLWPFVEQNITHGEWRNREAATAAFASVLEGPNDEVLKQLIAKVLPVLVTKHMFDEDEHVKDTATWTVGQICFLHPHIIPPNMPQLMEALGKSLSDEPRIASHCCWALHNIAAAFKAPPSVDMATNELTPYFKTLIEVIVRTAERNDAHLNNLRCSAFECLNAWIQSAPKDCFTLIRDVLPTFLNKLEATLQMQVLNMEDKDRQNEIQGLLCSTIQSITLKIEGEIKPIADRMMTILLQVYSGRSFSVQEEAVMAMGAVAFGVGEDFKKYMEAFYPILLEGLKNTEEYTLCRDAVGVVGDIARALGPNLARYCNELVSVLLQNLKNPHLHRDVKPPILICFGDIALAIEAHFETYLPAVMMVLQQACLTQVDMEDYDMVEYLVLLRQSILMAYTGILHGLQANSKVLVPYAEQVVVTIKHIWNDVDNREAEIAKNCIAVLGDIASSLQQDARQFLANEEVASILSTGQQYNDPEVKETAAWATKIIQMIIQPSGFS